MSTMILPEVHLAVQNDHGSGARARGALVAGPSGFSTAWRSAARPRSPLTIFFTLLRSLSCVGRLRLPAGIEARTVSPRHATMNQTGRHDGRPEDRGPGVEAS